MSDRLQFVTPLFVPGHRPELVRKAMASGADAIIIDLEDAVPGEAKERARASIGPAVGDLLVIVRINGTGTPWHNDDLAAALRHPITAIMFPKAELGQGLGELGSSADFKVPLIALLETAQGISESRAVAALPNVARLAFGSFDYCADIGCAHTRDSLLQARSEIVLASRLAARPAPVDGVTGSIDDAEVLKDDARYAGELGFGGKLCIHPRQIGPVREGFMPREDEIIRARRILASGEGAAKVDGMMVDEPVRARARSVLRRAKLD
jgi:citrate lyase subunit beta/citryl-CoA lyase